VKQSTHDILTDWCAGRQVVFFPNPGNAGDALIAAATWQYFDRLGIRPVVTRPQDFQRGSNLILGGGGNLVPHYRSMADALEACLARDVARCLLLPHSIRGHEALLSSLDGRFTVVCRELASLEHVRKHAPRAISLLADDMAMGLDFDALKQLTSSLRHRLALVLDRSWRKRGRKWRRALARMGPDSEGRLTILRSDFESASGVRGSPEHDLPKHYSTQCRHRAGCEQVAMDIHTLLLKARKVRTDRLHIALPAALLGLEVEILDNNYGKLSAVWETSLAAGYPKVRIVAPNL